MKPDMNKILTDCQDLVVAFNEVLEKKYGKDFLISDDEDRFLHESAVVSMVSNRLISIVASLVLQRVLETGATLDEVFPEVKEALVSDAAQSADEALARVLHGLAEISSSRKKPTSH